MISNQKLKLPEFVGMSLYGFSDALPRITDIEKIDGVQYVRVMSAIGGPLWDWEFYVASDVDKKDAVIAQIESMEGVLSVQVTSLRHR